MRAALIRIFGEATGAYADVAEVGADDMEHEHGRYVSDVFA